MFFSNSYICSVHRVTGIYLIVLLTFFLSEVGAQVIPSFGGSRTGTTGMQFLKISPDARSAGLAGNGIATVSDLSSTYWNPAGLVKLDSQKIHFQFGHTAYFADLAMEYGAVAFRFEESALALSIISLNSGDMNVTTEFQPNGTGEVFSSSSSTFSISFAKYLTDRFNFGVNLKLARESLAGINTNNALLDFGFQYDIGLANTRFAVSMTNFGFNVSPSGELKLLKLTGAESADDFEQISVPAVFRIGMAWDALTTNKHLLTALAQLNHPTDNNETFGLAAEYSYQDIFFWRMGYELGADEQGIPSFGAGLKTKRNFGSFSIDYGFNNKNRLGTTHRFTLGFGLI